MNVLFTCFIFENPKTETLPLVILIIPLYFAALAVLNCILIDILYYYLLASFCFIYMFMVFVVCCCLPF